jgi:hypothetical protein
LGRDDDFSSSMGDNGLRALTLEPMSEEKLKPAQAEATEEKISELTDDELDGVAGGVDSLLKRWQSIPPAIRAGI